ncbi:MAG: hypothetical protein HGB36_11525 [Chlorobiaceae bacterium]|nr:hypothetical protein [Chlorobiaceae bacterium]
MTGIRAVLNASYFLELDTSFSDAIVQIAYLKLKGMQKLVQRLTDKEKTMNTDRILMI